MRDDFCGDIGEAHIGRSLSVCGWVDSRRDHGGVIFIDLRDDAGFLQIVADPAISRAAFEAAESARSEYVLRATGLVRSRPPGLANPARANGMVELAAETVEILNAAEIPFTPGDETVGEEARLRHRVFDLRGARLQRNLRLRHKISRAARDFLDGAGFVEIETPMLTRSTPEGARDFLVPARLYPGEAYALPQSPQLFKQMLMTAGFARYYQIAKCFRDEDLRADRQPEFTQIDIEMSFANEQDILAELESFARATFAGGGVELPSPFTRLTFAESKRRFGVDRPDLRIENELIDIADLARETDFRVFRDAAESSGGRVACLRMAGGAAASRGEIDALTAFVARFGAKGLAYIKINRVADGAAGMSSPILKFLPDAIVAQIAERAGARDGDLLFFGAGDAKIVDASLGALRIEIARPELAQKSGVFRPVWIVDFPLFESDDKGALAPCHHPFTAPADEESFAADPRAARARAYDLVVNGVEIGGGSIRIHKPQTQLKMLSLLGIDEKTARERFGFLLRALAAGAPPHGGAAFGLDRIVMMICGAESIRDVIAFPKTQRGQCLLTDAPSPVDEAQWRELGIAPPREKRTT